MPRWPEYRWNAEARRYVGPDGRFVAQAAVREALDRALARSMIEARRLSRTLQNGETATLDWERRMRDVISDVHLYAAAAAKGGWAELTASDYGRVGQILREQYTYLNRFASEIDSGAQRLDGRFLRRVELYLQSGRRTYHLVERREEEARGMTEERSVLHPADHCDECVLEEALGWSPIGTLTPIGERQCLTNCRCSIEYR